MVYKASYALVANDVGVAEVDVHLDGYIVGLTTLPGSPPPRAVFDVELLFDTEDLLDGCGRRRLCQESRVVVRMSQFPDDEDWHPHVSRDELLTLRCSGLTPFSRVRVELLLSSDDEIEARDQAADRHA